MRPPLRIFLRREDSTRGKIHTFLSFEEEFPTDEHYQLAFKTAFIQVDLGRTFVEHWLYASFMSVTEAKVRVAISFN